MTENQVKEQLYAAVTTFPETFKLVTISYGEAFINPIYAKDKSHFRVFVSAWPEKLNPNINNWLCDAEYESIDDARKAIEIAFKDNEELKKELTALEEEKLFQLGYKKKGDAER